MKKLIIYQKPNGVIYYKLTKGNYMNYKVGCFNQYNHKILFILSDSDLINYQRKGNLLRKVIRKIISFLQYIYKRL